MNKIMSMSGRTSANTEKEMNHFGSSNTPKSQAAGRPARCRNNMINQIVQGNCLEVLREMPDELVDCIVTSPPYWGLRAYEADPVVWPATAYLGNGFRVVGTTDGCKHEWGDGLIKKTSDNYNESFNERWGNSPGQKKQEASSYGQINQGQFCGLCNSWRGQLGLEPTIELYISHLVEIFAECKRVLKKTGTMWINIGDTYNAGRDGGHPGGKKQWKDDRYVGQSGTNDTTVPAKSLCQIPERLSIALADQLGLIKRNTIIWWKRNCMPSSASDRFTVDFEPIYFFVKDKSYWFEQQLEEYKESSIVRMEYPRYGEGSKGMTGEYAVTNPNYNNSHGRNKRTVWDIKPINPTEAAWLAALIDGEGFIGVNIQKAKGTNKKDYFRPKIEIAMLHRLMLDKCVEITGVGKVYSRKKGKRGRECFTWSVSGKDTEIVLIQICPYLMLKSKQARLLIELSSLNQNGRNQYTTDESYERRKDLCNRIHYLNQTKFVMAENLGYARKSSLWDVPTEPSPESHFAVYPRSLVYTPIKAGCPPQGVVLDPFAGTGTTCLEAKEQGKNYIGIELSEKYIEIAENRLRQEVLPLSYKGA